MALKQLMIVKKIEQRKAALAALTEQETELTTRTAAVEVSLDEAKTDEEVAAVEEEIGAIDTDKAELEQKKGALESEIADLEGQLEQLNSKEPKNKGGERKMENNLELRETIANFIRSKAKNVRETPEPAYGFKVIDGGALIPEEIMPPKEALKDVVDLSKYVRVAKVNRGSGKIPVIKKSGNRMVSVAELEKNPELAKPTITDVPYDIVTYRGYIPVSQEAIEDADYDIVGLVAAEIADQELNTKNTAIAAVLKTAPAAEYDETTEKALPVVGLDGLKTLLNTKIKQVYNTKLYVSASLYNELDLTKDKNGRYMLQDSITAASGKSFAGREVVVLDDEVIGTSVGDMVAFIGDASEFCTLFDRKRASVKWTDHNVYGELLAGFVRFDVEVVDEEAGFYVTYEAEAVDPEV